MLLYGAPGTGKTLLAGAVANEFGLNFVSIKVSQIIFNYNMVWVFWDNTIIFMLQSKGADCSFEYCCPMPFTVGPRTVE